MKLDLNKRLTVRDMKNEVDNLEEKITRFRFILAQKEVTLNCLMNDLGYDEDFIVDINKPVRNLKDIYNKFRNRKVKKSLEI